MYILGQKTLKTGKSRKLYQTIDVDGEEVCVNCKFNKEEINGEYCYGKCTNIDVEGEYSRLSRYCYEPNKVTRVVEVDYDIKPYRDSTDNYSCSQDFENLEVGTFVWNRMYCRWEQIIELKRMGFVTEVFIESRKYNKTYSALGNAKDEYGGRIKAITAYIEPITISSIEPIPDDELKSHDRLFRIIRDMDNKSWRVDEVRSPDIIIYGYKFYTKKNADRMVNVLNREALKEDVNGN